MNGHIRLFRKFLKWEWYNNEHTKTVFLHCLLKANWKESKFEGLLIPRGSFITGRQKLAKELGISEQSIRTALKHLKSTNELTIKSTNKYMIITVVNYDLYQEDINKSTNKSTNELTNNQPTTNQQLTTYEEFIEEFIENSVCNNSACAREGNICHFNLEYKNENCINCMKKNICKNPTSHEFKFLHGGKTVEEWDKEREEELKKVSDKKIEIDDFDYLEETNDVIEGEKI